MTAYDDDGQKLVDDNGQPLIPLDPKLEYDKGSAGYLSAFAGSYRMYVVSFKQPRKVGATRWCAFQSQE
eukprot:4362525-Karenia_brevis.AAC.1